LSVRLNRYNEGVGIYFITFTYDRWKPLIAQTTAYGAVYKWFDYLVGKGTAIIGYVMMPNHLLVYLPAVFKTPGYS
jgi:hypothetical protein